MRTSYDVKDCGELTIRRDDEIRLGGGAFAEHIPTYAWHFDATSVEGVEVSATVHTPTTADWQDKTIFALGCMTVAGLFSRYPHGSTGDGWKWELIGMDVLRREHPIEQYLI